MNELKTDLVYCGDNLEIMHRNIPDGAIDLIYLDPPFGTRRNYKENGHGGEQTFSDSWSWDSSTSADLETLRSGHPALGRFLDGIIAAVGQGPVAAYLVMMAPRLLEMRRVLNEIGSIYLHCNQAAGHYLKLVMDAVFGADNFRNEIIWSYKGGGRSRKQFARKHDTILFYSKSGRWTFNYDDILVDRTNRTWFTDEKGRYWLKYGRKYYLEHDGKVPEDWWTDIDPLHGPYRERLGYPTQKPLALLERIIRAGSNPSEAVLDPFCGSGTTLVAARKLGRRWIGIDISQEAVKLSRERLSTV